MKFGRSGAVRVLTALLLVFSLGLCGCSQNDNSSDDNKQNTASSTEESKVFIERNDAGEPSAPEESISFKEA